VANPFRFAAPVDGEYFAGRRHELADLTDRVQNHLNVAVISPRRFGKTSLINEVCARAAARGATVVRIDAMFANDDIGLFASRLVSAVYKSAGPWHKAKDSLSSFLTSFRQFQPTVTIGTDGPSFSFATAPTAQDPTAIIDHAYGLVAGGTDPILVVDEFQELTRMPGNVPGLFKAMADAYAGVSLVIAGSKAHMMQQLTADSRGPLYGMMYRLNLKPIPTDEMGDYVERRFNVGGKPITRALADRITELAGPVPSDIQHLGYDVFAAVESSRDVTADDVGSGMQAVVEQAADSFVDTFTALTGNQRRLLIALAAAPAERPQSAGFVRRTGYANPSGVARGLASLADADVVTQRDGQWCVIDPFVRQWLAAQAG
jgi:hypothetical protein